MTKSPLVLAVDLGGQTARAIVFDRAGDPVADASAPIDTVRPREAWVEHDPEQVLGALREAIDGVAAAGDVAAAGLATQRSSVVCWDRSDGTALSPVIS